MNNEILMYDLVRPTKEWISNQLNEIYILEDWFGEKEVEVKKQAMFMACTSVGYVTERSFDGRYSVNWLTDSQMDYFSLHNAWWHKEELEVIGNALKICKDLI